MNAPFQSGPVVPILADVAISISDLKRNPAAAVEAAQTEQVAILSRNKPVAYLIAPHVWEYLSGLVTENRLIREAQEELDHPEGANIEIDLAKYLQD